MERTGRTTQQSLRQFAIWPALIAGCILFVSAGAKDAGTWGRGAADPAGAGDAGTWGRGAADPAGGSFAAGKLEVVIMDVGQGDGIYIRTPNGKNILIDAGPNARRGVLPFLRSRKIKVIDALVLTHPHADHIGGAVSPRDDSEKSTNSVLEYCTVREVLDSGKEHTTPEYKKILETVEARAIPYRQPRAGDRLTWDPALEVTVLHPDKAEYDNINDNSIMIRLVYGKMSFVFTGDAEEDAEGTVLSRFGGQIKSDVLKVAHHGSRTSSTQAFLDAVQPRYALISCGYKNSFNHPRPETLEHLAAVDAKVLRTDQDGFLTFKTDGRTIQWSRTPTPFPIMNFDPGQPENPGLGDWSGTASSSGGGVTLNARAGENLWTDAASAPRWTRSIPSSPIWSCAVDVQVEDGYKTEAGLALFVNEKNFVLFGIQDGRMTALTVVRNGRLRIGPELVVARPSKIALRRTAQGLEALAYDDKKQAWRRFWTLTNKQIPKTGPSARIGFYAKSWGNAPASATFKNVRMAAIP